MKGNHKPGLTQRETMNDSLRPAIYSYLVAAVILA